MPILSLLAIRSQVFSVLFPRGTEQTLSAACPVPLDTNHAGTGGQQLGLANAQLGSHYPETRCVLSVKKPYWVSCGYIKTMHSWVKTLNIFKLAWFGISLFTFCALSGRGWRWTSSHFGFITASQSERKKECAFSEGHEAVMLHPRLHKPKGWQKLSRIPCWHLYHFFRGANPRQQKANKHLKNK